ncbi:hypothetical protein [Flagellimonas sp.]|uniref:hypothetical protein n=1 Tax=Flagellimonas sp. TaxID=2058762 RepID=UPI003B5A3C66
MKKLTSKTLLLIASFCVLACNSSSNEQSSSVSEEMALLKEETNINVNTVSNFSALKSSMDDDREL